MGVAGPDRIVTTVTLGPGHPSSHGPLRLAVEVEDGRIHSAEALVGFLHRGAEKLFEARDYRQIGMLADRHDWLSAFGGELGAALVVERMLGLTVPPRATWLRTLFAELTRLTHHLAFLGTYPVAVATHEVVAQGAWPLRNRLLALVGEATGNRIHPMFAQVGGLREDVPDGWTERAAGTVDDLRPAVEDLCSLVESDPGVVAATRGVGILEHGTALAHGASGPVARASGIPYDLRVREPYLAYADLDVRMIVREEGDAHARLSCMAAEARQSLGLVARCLAALPQGPVSVRLPKVVRAPAGHAYAATENPGGINGYYLVSRGDRVPWRLKIRTASFAHAQLLGPLLTGQRVADLPAVLASLFLVVGDIDR